MTKGTFDLSKGFGFQISFYGKCWELKLVFWKWYVHFSWNSPIEIW